MNLRFGQIGVVTLLVFLMAGCEEVDNYVTKAVNDSGQKSDVAQPTGTSETTTPVTSGSSSDEAAHGLDLSKASVMGSFDFRSAQITTTLTGCSLGGGQVTLSWQAHSWPYYDGSSDGLVCAVWKTGSGWTGAYFDWCPAGREGYTWSTENIGVYVNLSSGTEVGFFILSVDTEQRSNVLFTTWP